MKKELDDANASEFTFIFFCFATLYKQLINGIREKRKTTQY